MEHKISEGVVVKLQEGKLSVEADLKAIVKPKLDELKADIVSGKIDPIKGTSIDQTAMLSALAYLEMKLLG